MNAENKDFFRQGSAIRFIGKEVDSVAMLPRSFIDQLEKKRLIFTISAGRSGTGYLAKMLSYLPNVISLHEPEPKFSNFMRTVQTNPETALHFWLLHKLPFIARLPEDIYIETSHLFVKGFIEPIIKLGFVNGVIILTRPAREIAVSLYRLNTIPARTRDGLKFLLSPEDPCVINLPGWQSLSDYQLCYWYCLEIQRRTNYYRDELKKKCIKVVETTLEDVTKPDGIKSLIDELELSAFDSKSWRDYINEYKKKINTKSEIKQYGKGYGLANIDMLEEKVFSLIREANKI